MAKPSLWVERYIGGIISGGRVLDVACGAGRHIGLAREFGYPVVGVDRDVAAAAMEFGGDPGVDLVAFDLENGRAFPFAPGSFSGVVVTNYLWRPILPDIVAAVAGAGVLVYETFRIGNERFGKPSCADFLLRPNELLEAIAGRLHVVAYEEAELEQPARLVARVCAVGRDHPWVAAPPRMDRCHSTDRGLLR